MIIYRTNTYGSSETSLSTSTMYCSLILLKDLPVFSDCEKQPGADSDVNRLKLGLAETVYRTSRREPLGKGYQRGHQLPQKVRAARGDSSYKMKTCSCGGAMNATSMNLCCFLVRRSCISLLHEVKEGDTSTRTEGLSLKLWKNTTLQHMHTPFLCP